MSPNRHHAECSQGMTPCPPTVTRVRQFVSQGHSCCHRDCLRRLWEGSQDELHAFGEAVAACSPEAKEAALLMNLREHLTMGSSRRGGSQRQRPYVAYTIAPFGRLCRQAYLLLWDIGRSTLQALLRYMTSHSDTFCPRTHGLTGAAPNHSLPPEIQQEVIDFIVEFGEQFGEDDEGRHGRRVPHSDGGPVLRFLPASYTIGGLYRLFSDYSAQKASVGHASPLVSFSTFRHLFHSPPCQHIRIRRPHSDVCDACTMFRAFYRHHAVDECAESSSREEEHITQWQHHVQRAQEAREAYNADLLQARKTLKLLLQGNLPLAGYVAHYTFDFMQSLAIPQFADQTKDMYYFSLRNIHLFSIRDDGAQQQYNYLYDEGEGGKGANYVISLLFHFLGHRAHEAAAIVVHLHADNCSGQTKNNLVMQFFVLLVSLGVLTHVEMKFLIKGHTHCSVDGGHGLIKKAWRMQNVFTLDQAASVVDATSPMRGQHHAIVITSQDFFDWERLLSTYFRTLPKILSFQQFEMDAKRPGRLRYRQHQAEAWQEIGLFKKGIERLPGELSSIEAIRQHLTPLSPPGIPLKKQHVLYDKVRKYVPPAYQDSICPLPDDEQEAQVNKNAMKNLTIQMSK